MSVLVKNFIGYKVFNKCSDSKLHLLSNFIRYNSNSKQKWLERQRSDHFTAEAKLQNLRSRAAFKLMEIDDKFKLFDRNKNQRVLDLGFAPGAWSQVAKSRTADESMILGIDILPCDPPLGVSSIQANILSKKTHDLIRLFFSKHFQLNKHDELHKHHGYFQEFMENKLDKIEQEKIDKNDKLYREVFTNDPTVSSIEKLPIDVIISDMYEPWQKTTNFWNNFTNLPYNRMANTSGLAIKDHSQSIDLCDAALVSAIDLLRPNGSFVCKLYTGKEDKLLENRMNKVFKKVQRFKPNSSRSESKEIYFVGLKKRNGIDKLAVFTS